MKLLHIDTSIMGEESVTRQLSRLIVDTLMRDMPTAEVSYRDLVSSELPHLTRGTLPRAHRLALDPATLDPETRAAQANSDIALAEFLAADVIVIGAPMYNFSVPSQLKAWLDRIMIGGATFRYGPDGPEGLAAGKRVIVAVARGGFYETGSDAASDEHAERYLRSMFGFIGITDPVFILADGMGRGGDVRARAIAAAHDAVRALSA